MNRYGAVCVLLGHAWRPWLHPSVPGAEVVIRCIRCGVLQEPSERSIP